MDYLRPPRQFSRKYDRRQDGLLVPTKPFVSTVEAIWDASNAGSLTLSGSNVNAWGDISGNNHHMAKDAFAPTTGGTINGLNAIQFAGAQGMTPPSAFMVGAASGTLMAIIKVTSTGVQNSGGPYRNWGGSGQHNHCTFSDAHLYTDWGQTGRPDVGAPAVGTTGLLTILTGPGDFRVRWNRAALFTTGTNTVAWNSTALFGGPGFGADGTFNWGGLMGEVRMWKSLLSGADIATYEAVLATKWGTP